MTTRVEAFGIDDLNPLTWLGNAASEAIGDVWMAAMTGLWSAALWLLKLAFKIIDAFTTPDLSARGPMGAVLPTTLWLGASLAVIMMMLQLTVALVRRDGQSLGRILIGIGQFGLVWAGYLGLAAGFVAAASGLSRGILQSMLQAQDLSHVDLSRSFPSQVGDLTLATVLGVLGLLIVIPASFFYVLIMFVREAALIILVATAPISAAGLVSETGKTWFWKTLRWFFSCLLISPVAALLLGIGVKLSTGVIAPPPKPGAGGLGAIADYANKSNTAHAGMAVVGCLIVAVGAVCPMILFRLLAFVEPGTASGAALRQSWSDAGGMSGLLGRAKPSIGGSAASQTGVDGRSGGEAGAESQTRSRLATAVGMVGAGVQAVSTIANKAADVGSDVLGQAGIGAPGYSPTPTDARSARSGRRGSGSPASAANSATRGAGWSGAAAPVALAAQPPDPPTPVALDELTGKTRSPGDGKAANDGTPVTGSSR